MGFVERMGEEQDDERCPLRASECDAELARLREIEAKWIDHDCVIDPRFTNELARLRERVAVLEGLVREGAGLHREMCESATCSFVARCRALLSPAAETKPAATALCSTCGGAGRRAVIVIDTMDSERNVLSDEPCPACSKGGADAETK